MQTMCVTGMHRSLETCFTCGDHDVVVQRNFQRKRVLASITRSRSQGVKKAAQCFAETLTSKLVHAWQASMQATAAMLGLHSKLENLSWLSQKSTILVVLSQ